MVLDAVSNFVRGTTDAAVDNSQTTVSVTDASIFPDPSTDGEFNVVIWDVNNFPRPDQDTDVEILRVTAIDTGTDTLTVARGQEMTVAAAHPSGSAVHLSPTAKMFSDIEDTFADFWDASTQELTGDVNNSVVNTDQGTITNLDGTSLQYEQVGVTSAYQVDIQPNLMSDKRLDIMSTLLNQKVGNTDARRGIGYELFIPDAENRLYLNEGGNVIELGAPLIGDIKAAAISREVDGARRILAQGGTTAYLYDSESDFDSGTVKEQQSITNNPLDLNSIVGFEDTGLGEDKFLFAEYGADAEPNIVWKVDPFATAGNRFSNVLDVSTSKIRHLHCVQQDPYNPSDFYVASGDADDDIFMWKSTDFGDTWTEEVNASVDTSDPQVYRFLNLTFTPDYIYWVDDRRTECKLVRATRSGITSGSYEVLHTFGTDATGRGVSRFFDFEGLVVNINVSSDRTELWYYDIDNDKISKLIELPAVEGWAGNTPYQNMQTGKMYMNVKRGDSIFNNVDTQTQVAGIGISKTQIETG